jgi:ComF family protein
LIFDLKSSWSGRGAGQLIKEWAIGLDQDCALCGAPAGCRLVCAPCEAGLPRLGQACARCATPLPLAGTCGRCLREPPSFESASAPFLYAFPLDRMVQRFKFGGDLALGRWLALRLAHRVRELPRPALLVSPPLSPARLRDRGFNQALEIARVVGHALDIPVALGAIQRVRDTAHQPGLGLAQRRANLRGAFRCRIDLRGRPVALVDDVVTTAATMQALGEALAHAGAGPVHAWAVARTPLA